MTIDPKFLELAYHLGRDEKLGDFEARDLARFIKDSADEWFANRNTEVEDFISAFANMLPVPHRNGGQHG